MTDTLKILGQSAPAATTATTLYTTPASTSTMVSSILACNRGASDTTFRVWFSIGGAADADKQYAYFDRPLPAYETFLVTAGMPSLSAGDLIRVYAGNGNVTFQAFGVEVTP